MCFAQDENELSVVLKVFSDAAVYEDEKRTLTYFQGSGMVRLLKSDDVTHSLLLERVSPGTSLLQADKEMNEKVALYAQAAQGLMHARGEISGFNHCSKWLESIDRACLTPNVIEQSLLEKACALKDMLLKTAHNEHLLHGDLHFDNILLAGQGTPVVIDPKGIVGEWEFEVAHFNFVSDEEAKKIDVHNLFIQRVTKLVSQLALNRQRLVEWIYVRLVLGACWCVEDNLNPEWFIKRLKVLFPENESKGT